MVGVLGRLVEAALGPGVDRHLGPAGVGQSDVIAICAAAVVGVVALGSGGG